MTTKPSVLIVEDEAIIAMMLEQHLRNFGCEVITKTATGEEAIRLIESTQFSLVLLDLHLAGMLEGIDVARTLRKVSPTTAIFIMTAFGAAELQPLIDEIHPEAFLEKPVSTPLLKKLYSDLITSSPSNPSNSARL